MGGIKKIFDFYINSSIHVALAVVALILVTDYHFQISIDLDLLAFVFFGSITAYNFIKYAGIAKLHHRSLAKNLKMLQVFSFLCFLALVYFTFQVSKGVLVVAGILGLLTLLYALPVFNKKNLRSIAGIKVYVIALIWAGVSVLFPAVNADLEVDLNLTIEFFQRFLFVLVLLIPFEIRDLKYDAAHLRTIPQRHGTKRTKWIGILLLLLVLFLEIFKETTTWPIFIADVVTILLTGFFVLNSREDQYRYYSIFLVEAVPIFWAGLLYILVGSSLS